jgi:hypothetical protein
VGAVSVLAGGGGTLLGGIIVKKLGNALTLSFHYFKYYYPWLDVFFIKKHQCRLLLRNASGI